MRLLSSALSLKQHWATERPQPDKCFRSCQTEAQGWPWIPSQISEHEDTSYLKNHNQILLETLGWGEEASDDVPSRGRTNNICCLLNRARPFVAGWGCNMLHLLVTNFIENDSSSCCERRGVVML